MQSAPRPTGQQTSVKIYNAVYSSVQVYECMVRGIAVMRRRADSFVNATQILKVAGVDKGRRTKILEKEILPGKHEIVQGGYGKYQGTWIPLERGRDLAIQYGIAPLLSPLFDFIPNQQPMPGIPNALPNMSAINGPRPLSAAASYPSISGSNSYSPGPGPAAGSAMSPNQLGPAPIMPGSALRLLNQGRAQGLFTPSTTALMARQGAATNITPGGSYYPGLLPGFSSSQPTPGGNSHPQSSLKRTRTDSEIDLGKMNGRSTPNSFNLQQGTSGEQPMADARRPSSRTPSDYHMDVVDEPSPAKRPRPDADKPPHSASHYKPSTYYTSQSRTETATPQPHANGFGRTDSLSSTGTSSRPANGTSAADRSVRSSTKPTYPKNADKTEALKDPRRTAIMAAICQSDDAPLVTHNIREASRDSSQDSSVALNPDWDIVIDDQGHTPLHVAASLAHLETVKALVAYGADIHRGNYQGETPLIRSILATHNHDNTSLSDLLVYLHPSIRTIDTAKRSVLHHATLVAGVKGRAPYAKYYLESILGWLAKHEEGDFRSIIDVQDEHGDTALNIAARVGNRSLVRALLDVGANKILPNKLGLRPGDFGVEPDELSGALKAEDLLSSLRTMPSVPVQKSQDVIADLSAMIQKLSTDFATEIKSKQDAFDMTQAQLRAATRELADQRKQIAHWQQKAAELDQVKQRVRNIEKAKDEEDEVDWTGRTEADGQPSDSATGPAFTYRGSQSTMTDMGNVGFPASVENEPAVPMTNSLASLIKLRRMKMFQDRIEKILSARLKGLQGASAEKEYQCKKIVALCTGIELDKVEDMLENLVIAVESESQIIDIGRVSGFMQKVRDGII